MKKILLFVVLTMFSSIMIAADVIFYDGEYNDGKWHSYSASSSLVLINGELPTSQSVKMEGKEGALELTWKAAATWLVKIVANANWTAVDMGANQYLTLSLFSPVDFAKNDLPAIGCSNGGSYTNSILLGRYLNDNLSANTWTTITVPLTDFTWNPERFTSIAQITLEDWNGTVAPGSLFIGSIMFTDTPTSMVSPSIKENAIIYGQNGAIHIDLKEASPIVIYNANGQMVYRQSLTHQLVLSLTQGVYIVRTADLVQTIAIQ